MGNFFLYSLSFIEELVPPHQADWAFKPSSFQHARFLVHPMGFVGQFCPHRCLRPFRGLSRGVQDVGEDWVKLPTSPVMPKRPTTTHMQLLMNHPNAD